MAMDDRKQRILMAIVTLHADAGEPVGSHLLSRHFDMAVSSATLRNEMAALTKLGLLEQPHTSAGRVPTAKGYRYYVDNLLGAPSRLSAAGKAQLEDIFPRLDYDPEKLAQGAARAFSRLLGLGVVVTTPRSDDMVIAHYEVLRVGLRSAAVLAVTGAGGVRTRVARLDTELTDSDAGRMAETLNRSLRFVAAADVSPALMRGIEEGLGSYGLKCRPVLEAARTLLTEAGKPSVYFEGQQYFLHWPELEPSLRALMELINNSEAVEQLIRPHRPNHTEVLFGDEWETKAIPHLCFVTHSYHAGGGLAGSVAIAGPTRMRFGEVIPRLEYFSELLGRHMSGSAA